MISWYIRSFLLILAINFIHHASAQEPSTEPTLSPIAEQQLEDLTEANEDAVTEDDSYLQEM